MKKKLRNIVFSLLGILLIFSACTGPEEFENVLIGTWKYINYQTGDWETIRFDEDLDYRLVNYNATSMQTVAIEGEYSYTDTTFTLERQGTYNLVFKYAVEDNALIVFPGKIYYLQ